MQRSRIEALLASFPKLADSGTQHTIAEQDNVRYVYQPLDELYMVLITNLQSNILQDINSLHLFAQVVSSICKSLDEREILKNAFELLTAFDEIVTLGYRENLTLSQIKTFLEMESHEERIQEIIARNKELEASEERKRRAKQLEMQRKEMSRTARGTGGMGGMGGMGGGSRGPSYPSYTPSAPATVPDTYDSYEADKKKSSKPLALGKKGMQLGKKSKSTNIFEQVAGELPPENEALVSTPLAAAAPAPASARQSTSLDREGVHITTSESISARLDREGLLKTFEVKGELQLKITDSSLTQVKLDIHSGDTRGAQLMTHPKVDKAAFKNDKVIQLADTSKGFPTNAAAGVGVMKWKWAPKAEDVSDPPITFRVWVEDSGKMFNINVEYELTGGDSLKDVSVTIPYQTDEPNVSSFDAVYEVSGDSLEWNIGAVDEDNSTGSFEFEAQADSESEFFPMRIRFSKSTPFVDVGVASVTLLSMNQDINFSKDIKSVADVYEIV
ncbi:coatomer subunit delta [Lophiotrema nucula]|uniref:Coatomer subunit delta n=1 Tax=Lophiotrema nucula TaxID=690887 RepID=A0A6A5ZPV4_9PLEO|nr:coatomer subunit delta [Lophiotrema nucula]